MALITYADKQAMGTQPSIPDVNKVMDSDMNEIKTAINNSTTYSTTETVVGTWVDNKPLYRLVIDTTGNMAIQQWKNLAPASNIDTFVFGYMRDGVDNRIWTDVCMGVTSTYFQYFSQVHTHHYTQAIVYYTKTTD